MPLSHVIFVFGLYRDSRRCMQYVAFLKRDNHFLFIGDSRIRQLYLAFVKQVCSNLHEVNIFHFPYRLWNDWCLKVNTIPLCLWTFKVLHIHDTVTLAHMSLPTMFSVLSAAFLSFHYWQLAVTVPEYPEKAHQDLRYNDTNLRLNVEFLWRPNLGQNTPALLQKLKVHSSVNDCSWFMSDVVQ